MKSILFHNVSLIVSYAQQFKELRYVMFDSLNIQFMKPIIHYMETQSAIAIANSSRMMERRKHKRLKWLKAQETVAETSFKIQHIETKSQTADTLPKPLLRTPLNIYKSVSFPEGVLKYKNFENEKSFRV